MKTTDPKSNPRSFLVNGFLIEADACAAEVMYAHEMREKNPKIWEAHQKSGYAPMSTEFEKTFNETGDTEKARESALLKWYDLKVKGSYGDTYVKYMAYIARALKKQKEMEPQYLSTNKSTQKMVDKLCVDYDKKPFMTDGKKLETPEKLFINEEQAKKLSKALIPYMAKYNRTPEKLGLPQITVVRPDGTKTTCDMIMQQVKDEQKLNNALKAMSNKNQGR